MVIRLQITEHWRIAPLPRLLISSLLYWLPGRCQENMLKAQIENLRVGRVSGIGKGEVLMRRGQKAPILGRVCMDQFMVDISGIPGAMEGDKVTLLGADGQERITAEELGELSGRFNYEFVCTLGKRIPRVYRRNGEITEVKDYFENF